MRKVVQFSILLCSAILWQSCGTKTEQANADMTDSVVVIDEKTVVDENKTNDEVVAKRATIEKARLEKLEERKVAQALKAKESATYKDASGKIVYNKAEVDPSYTGGDKAMMKYLRDNIKYPEKARDNGIEGTVFVNFIVDEKGKVREVVASDVVGDDIDQTLKDESVRVVTAMPVWVAGRQHGKNVDVNFSIPITFELSN